MTLIYKTGSCSFVKLNLVYVFPIKNASHFNLQYLAVVMDCSNELKAANFWQLFLQQMPTIFFTYNIGRQHPQTKAGENTHEMYRRAKVYVPGCL